ncbi:hypothetical protein PV08_09160 [Exophiala spinifera]|uniref:G-protein coupled receptors family 1 profile domain-containing protein n=1 Tax=Exophiala spinifera TaxID=91928 RepID=A0A0D1ZFX9_9EURO|nr:uncharacterized protein PV08_09160 [Exophiala spinifera]KIW11887.1 hypothetical protein PV08_09160 [Exophiala spinifera]
MLEALTDAILNARDEPIDYTGDGNGAGGALKPSQNRAIHITAVCCSGFSLLAALVTLRWFLLMRRSFRHILVMNMIISGSFKSFWYFIFPIVSFGTGPISSSSNFCQATGFFLTFATESADMAIFLIALHSVLYILRPSSAAGEGGLYPYRHWVWPAWLLPPLLAACLAFIRNSAPFTTSGVFCTLPKRPIWYRLALSWVPRYIIIAFIISMYLWIYIYVHMKFRGFDKLGRSESMSESSQSSRRSSIALHSEDVEPAEQGGRTSQTPSRRVSQQPTLEVEQQVQSSEALQPWDYMNFVTSKPLQNPPEDGPAPTAPWGSTWSDDTISPFGPSSGKPSRIGSKDGQRAGPRKERVSRSDPATNTRIKMSDRTDPLRETRRAIRRQLRSMFIYPLVYIIVWAFPFVFQVRLYDARNVMHPTYWINLISVIMLSLQTAADCFVFSWTEKPWRRISSNSKCSILGGRRCKKQDSTDTPQPAIPEPAPSKRPVHWWEAEGRLRKDSVWLPGGSISETFSQLASRTRSRSLEQGRRLTRHISEDIPSPIPETEPVSSTGPPAGRARRTSMSRVSSNGSGQEPRSSPGRRERHQAGLGSVHEVKSDGFQVDEDGCETARTTN